MNYLLGILLLILLLTLTILHPLIMFILNLLIIVIPTELLINYDNRKKVKVIKTRF